MIEITTDNLDSQKYGIIVNMLEKVTGNRIPMPEGISRTEFIRQCDWSIISTLLYQIIQPILLNSNIIAQLKSRQHLTRLLSELEKLPNQGVKITIELPDGTEFQLSRHNAHLLWQAFQNYSNEH